MEGNTSGPGNPSSSRGTENTFENLYPSLLQCFSVILVGYCVGRVGYISPTSSKGIGVFVGVVSLPALIFKSLVEIDYSKVNWYFLSSILIAKGTVFLSVVLFTLLLVRPTNFGKAGLFGILCSQSNDLALGLPLVKAMYQDTNPEYINYLYLMIPISLVILNPIGFVFLEIQKQKSAAKSEGSSTLKIILTAFKGVITDPIVFMTFIGLVGHFIFRGKLPQVVDEVFSALGQAFLATALFYLGVKMVGNMKTKVGSGLVVPLLLITAKSLFLPLIAREMVEVLDVGRSTNQTKSWSLFGFLYGTFPSAPSVAIFAGKYGIEEQLVTSTVVLSTLLSAPLMFISAQMCLLDFSSAKARNFEHLLKRAMIDVSGTAIPFALWVIVVLFLGRRHRIYPHNYTICVTVCQLLACVSTVLSTIPIVSPFWYPFVSVFFFVGVWGSRCWTAMVAVGLCLVRCKGEETVKRFRIWVWLFGFGLPILFSGIVTGVLLNTMSQQQLTPLFLYTMDTTFPVMVSSVLLLLICVIVIVTSLVYLQRHDRYCKCSKRLKAQCSGEIQENATAKEKDELLRCNLCVEKNRLVAERAPSSCSEVSVTSCTDETSFLLDKSPECRKNSYTDDLEKSLSIEVEAIFGGKSLEMDLGVQEYLKGEKHQLGRHVTMLLILLVMMIVGLFLALWILLKKDTSSGIFMALRFVDTFCMFGQTLVIFACFGFEKQLIIIPFLSRWRKFWYGVEEIVLPKIEDLDSDVLQRCEQFERYHKQRCRQSIVSDQRYRFRKYKSVFRGDQLVDWLLQVGLASDRQAAVYSGNCLILGRVIRHVTQAHFFLDSPYLYEFHSRRGSSFSALGEVSEES